MNTLESSLIPSKSAISTWRYIGLLLGPAVGSYALNAVTVTLPQIQSDFGASDAGLEMVVAGYSIPFAVLLILGGRLGDRYGRHRLFLIGMSLFFIASVICSFAPNIAVLVAARVLQGVGAALCTPQVLGTIQATSVGEARLRGIAAFGAAAGTGAAVGQVLGGMLGGSNFDGFDGWRVSYWVIAVIALAAIFLSQFAPRSRSHQAVDLDLAGVVELGLGLLLIATALTFGPTLGWDWLVFAGLAGGFLTLIALWWHQNRIERSGRVPLLPPSVLRLRPLQLGLLTTFLFFTGYGAMLYVVPRALESGLGVDSFGAGVVLLPFAVVFVITSLLVGPIQARLRDWTLIIGVTLQLLALIGSILLILLSWGPQLPLLLQIPFLVLGAGQALIFSPLTQIVVRGVPVEAAGLSGGMFSTIQQFALALGVILIGALTPGLGVDARGEFVLGFVFDATLAAAVLLLSWMLVRVNARRRNYLG